jgi:Uma2 family endonuclease
MVLAGADEAGRRRRMVEGILTHRFTVEEFHQMGAAGILTEDDRVELIEGELVDMSPIGLSHMACVDHLTLVLVVGVRQRAIVRVQGTVRLGPASEPQPDLLLLKPRQDYYRHIAAGPGDVLLLIEVADTSLVYDRTVKLPLYARAGIPEVWLIDLPGEAVQVCRGPTPAGYSDVQRVPRGGHLSPVAFPDLSIAVDEILG